MLLQSNSQKKINESFKGLSTKQVHEKIYEILENSDKNDPIPLTQPNVGKFSQVSELAGIIGNMFDLPVKIIKMRRMNQIILQVTTNSLDFHPETMIEILKRCDEVSILGNAETIGNVIINFSIDNMYK